MESFQHLEEGPHAIEATGRSTHAHSVTSPTSPLCRQLGKNYAPGHIATRQAAGAARVRFSEKSESMMPAAAALASWFWGTRGTCGESWFGGPRRRWKHRPNPVVEVFPVVK